MDFEIRADGSLHIEGYVNAVERDSRAVVCPECGKCVEQIKAGAFAAALRAADNVDLLLNHDKNRKAGSTSEGNLTLTEDSIGLRAAADITDSEIVSKAREGKLRGWSFGFNATDTSIEHRAEGLPRRHVKALRISEVSLIDDRFTPCYAGTSIELRADNGEELTETRFNPYHDPNDGRFTDAGGGGTGTTLYVGKGEKGNGTYVFAKELNGTDNPDFQKRNAAFIKENNRQAKHYPWLFENGDLTKAEYDEQMDTLAYDIKENSPYLMKDKEGKVYKTTGTVFNYKGKSYGYNNINGNDWLTDIQTSVFLPVRPGKWELDNIQSTAYRLDNAIMVMNRSGKRAKPVNADYIERYNKAVMDGYRIRAELASIPP